MEENLTARSFIARVYRRDTEDCRKITGLVEALGGSGKPVPFRDADELMLLLSKGTCVHGTDAPNSGRKGRAQKEKAGAA